METEKMVHYFARQTVSKCKYLDMKDVSQELRIAVFEAKNKYCSGFSMSLEGFIYRRLQWKSVDLIKKEYKQRRQLEQWSDTVKDRPVSCDLNSDHTYAKLCQEVVDAIDTKYKKTIYERGQKEKIKRMFLLLSGMEPVKARDYAGPKVVTFEHVYSYMHLPSTTGDNVLRKVREIVKKVVDDVR
jgi:hypothetical protein